jgi:hypothetical protein
MENEQKIEELLKENLKLSEEIKTTVDRIDNFVLWQKVMAALKILILILVIIAAFVWLPPFVKEFLEQITTIYHQITGISN